jgi:hypothetical protein
MKTTLSILPLSLACLACLAAPAIARDAAIPRKQSSRDAAKADLLARYDSDKDGKLGKDEIAAIARDRMLAHDKNKDGKVDAVELKKMREKSRKMPSMTADQRAMARERALLAAKLQQQEKQAAKSGESAE